MRAVGLLTHGGPEVLQLVELPEVHAGPGQVRIRVYAATVTRPTSAFATARAPNSIKLIPHPTCQEWRQQGSSMRLEAAFPIDSKIGDAVMAIVQTKAATARTASKSCSMPARL